MTLATLLPLLLSIATGEDTPQVDFSRDVRPILEARCFECHGPKKQKGKLRLDQRDSVLSGGDPSEPRVVPGKPEESHVFLRVSLPEDDPDVMPAEGPPLDAKEIDVIRTWIAEGASWPEVAPEATEKPTPAADREPLRPEPSIDFPPLEPAAAKRVDDALAALRARGASAVRIALDTEAIDVNLCLLGGAATDADVALVEGLAPRLVWLDLARTGVTDAGLAPIQGCLEIRRLSLASTAIGDAGLARLTKLSKLESLNLFGTAVTDAGIDRLKELRSLKRLFLWRTAVTDAGVEALRAAIPGLTIDRGGYAEEMAKLVPPAQMPAAAVNALCPISGKPIQAGFVFEHQGKTIGFCCGDCLAKFQATPDAFPLK
jgi:YHS domain-containing protein